MNIDLWLEEALKKVKQSDPDLVLKKLETYGLVEAQQEPKGISEPVSGCYFVVSNPNKKEGFYNMSSFYESELTVSAYQVFEETEFKVAPREAAPYTASFLSSSDHLSQNIFSQAA